MCGCYIRRVLSFKLVADHVIYVFLFIRQIKTINLDYNGILLLKECFKFVIIVLIDDNIGVYRLVIL